MKKRIITALLALLLLFSLVLPATAAEEKSEAQTAAETLYGYGLMLGVGTGADGSPDFALDNKLSREEAVTLLVRLLGAEDEAENGDWSCPFSDVSGWAEGYVGYAWAKGLTKGIGGGLFGAASDVTASQFITFVLRALGYSSETDFVWDSAWTLSDALGVTDGRYNAGTGDFLRGDAAIVSLGAVLACPKGESRTLLEILQSAPALSMEVHFIDVGQADCILVESDGEYMLVDAGNNADSELVVDYLRDEGVTTLDYLIGTHPHEETLDKLAAAGVSVFRTDLQGTIIAKSDGRSISWNVSPAA